MLRSNASARPRPARVRSVWLLVALALFAAACSSGGEEDETTTSDTAPAEESSSTASEPADDDMADDDTVDDDMADDDMGDDDIAEADPSGDDMADDDPAEETPSIFPLTITDAIGQEFTFDEPPRIGCLWYGCSETTSEIGAAVAGAGIGEDELNSPFFTFGGNPETRLVDPFNPEEWAAADVDLILNSEQGAGSPANESVAQAAPIFFLHYATFLGEIPDDELGGYDSYVENIRLLAQLTDMPEAADEAIARFDALKASLEALATPETAEQTLAILGAIPGYAMLGPESAFCVLLNETGHGTCVGEGVGQLLNSEAFLALNPSVIIHSDFGGDQTLESRNDDPIWGLLDAVQNDNVYPSVLSRYYCCSVSSLVLAMQEFVALVYPETGIDAPVAAASFDPRTSPLVTG
ncbi:MAG: ABC transporter substrate-binding protein [Actinomycetota bacterium]